MSQSSGNRNLYQQDSIVQFQYGTNSNHQSNNVSNSQVQLQQVQQVQPILNTATSNVPLSQPQVQPEPEVLTPTNISDNLKTQINDWCLSRRKNYLALLTKVKLRQLSANNLLQHIQNKTLPADLKIMFHPSNNFPHELSPEERESAKEVETSIFQNALHNILSHRHSVYEQAHVRATNEAILAASREYNHSLAIATLPFLGANPTLLSHILNELEATFSIESKKFESPTNDQMDISVTDPIISDTTTQQASNTVNINAVALKNMLEEIMGKNLLRSYHKNNKKNPKNSFGRGRGDTPQRGRQYNHDPDQFHFRQRSRSNSSTNSYRSSNSRRKNVYNNNSHHGERNHGRGRGKGRNARHHQGRNNSNAF